MQLRGFGCLLFHLSIEMVRRWFMFSAGQADAVPIAEGVTEGVWMHARATLHTGRGQVYERGRVSASWRTVALRLGPCKHHQHNTRPLQCKPLCARASVSPARPPFLRQSPPSRLSVVCPLASRPPFCDTTFSPPSILSGVCLILQSIFYTFRECQRERARASVVCLLASVQRRAFGTFKGRPGPSPQARLAGCQG